MTKFELISTRKVKNYGKFEVIYTRVLMVALLREVFLVSPVVISMNYVK